MIRKVIIVILGMLAVGTMMLRILGIRWHTTALRDVGFANEKRLVPDEYNGRSVEAFAFSGDVVFTLQHSLDLLPDDPATFEAPQFSSSRETRRVCVVITEEYVFSKAQVLGGGVVGVRAQRLSVEFPYWMFLVVFSVAPMIAFIRGPLRRYRRWRRNECVHCGYKLTGLPTPKCPECGKTSSWRLHSRLWRFSKWASLVVSLGILAALVLSLNVSILYGTRGMLCQLDRGNIRIDGFQTAPPTLGWRIDYHGFDTGVWASAVYGRILYPGYTRLWVLFLIAAVPTAILWRIDRRPSPRHCPQCGYNLTGNTSGVCPECGTKIEPAQK